MENVMKKAWEMYKEAGCTTKAEFAIALKLAWKEAKTVVTKVIRKDLKFANVSRWIESNVLAGFTTNFESNKYSSLTSQINQDATAVVIKVDESNLEYVASYDSYVVAPDVTDSNGEQKLFGKKWHKAFTILDNTWFGNSYFVVVQKKFSNENVWNEALELAKSQEIAATI